MTPLEPRTMVPRGTTSTSMHTLAPHRRLVAALATAGLALILLPGHLARAADITVTSTSGARGGPGCTLRDAITAANTDGATGGCPAGNGADTIILTAGATYTLTEVDNTGVNNGLATTSPTPAPAATVPAGATPRFVDNGVGTVTDRQTGLMWEQKTGTFDAYSGGVDCSTTTCSDPHNVNNQYAWSASGTASDGGAFTDFLPRVNGTLCDASKCTGLGGYSDWRLPTIWELHAILDPHPTASACGPGSFCIDQVFGPTAGNLYWSVTTYPDNPASAWGVWFYEGGGVGADVKTGYYSHSSNHARAVRGATQAPEIAVTSASGASGGSGCTLCDAITAAKTNLAVGGCPPGGGADTIILIAGARYTLTELDEVVAACTGIPQSNGLPSVTSEITIIGNGATIARSDTPDTPAFRLLHVAPGGRLSMNDLTLTKGKMPDIPATQPRPGGDGGGILNEGVLTLINVAVTANSAGETPFSDGPINPLAGCAGRGGGVFNAGTLTLMGGSVIFNHAGSNAPGDVGGRNCAGAGGGVYNDTAATLTLHGTSVNDNAAGDDVDLPGADGGGIFNAGNLVITNSTLTGNGAGYSDDDRGGNGGGIANVAGGTLTLVDSTVSGNQAGPGDSGSGDGGGIFNAGILTLTRCAVTNNASGCGEGCGNGGGVANDAGGTLTLIDSTVSGNRAGDDVFFGQGGGIFNNGTLRLASCTIAGNSGGGACDYCDYGKGGGIASTGPLATVSDTLIAGNVTNGAPSDCSGTLTSQGYNLIQDLTDCAITGDTTGNITNVDPHLGPLQSNGGPTETEALLPGSPAIDAGNPNGCTDPDGNILSTDQRGAPRAVAGDARCDIGAFEASWPAWPTITPTPTSTPTGTPTISPTPTPSLTQTPTLTPTATPTWAVAVDVGSAAGSPGQRVTIAVFLKSGTQNVVAIQNDIAFDLSTPVMENSDATPACAVNPAIHKSARFGFLSCSDWWPHSCWQIRALVFPLDGLSPIPDGSLLYTCSVAISPSATAGTHVLVNSGVIASDAAGHSLPATGGADGSIVVLSGTKGIATATTSLKPTSTATVPIARSIPTSTSPPALNGATAAVSAPDAPITGDGCALAPKPDQECGTWLALLLVAAFLVHRRGRSSNRWLSTS